jgi:hypothetical protein
MHARVPYMLSRRPFSRYMSCGCDKVHDIGRDNSPATQSHHPGGGAAPDRRRVRPRLATSRQSHNAQEHRRSLSLALAARPVSRRYRARGLLRRRAACRHRCSRRDGGWCRRPVGRYAAAGPRREFPAASWPPLRRPFRGGRGSRSGPGNVVWTAAVRVLRGGLETAFP